MATRIVLIHPGPSDECECDICRDDGSDATPYATDCDGTCCDDYGQGRTRASYDGSRRACRIALVGIVLTLGAALLWAWVKS